MGDWKTAAADKQYETRVICLANWLTVLLYIDLIVAYFFHASEVSNNRDYRKQAFNILCRMPPSSWALGLKKQRFRCYLVLSR